MVALEAVADGTPESVTVNSIKIVSVDYNTNLVVYKNKEVKHRQKILSVTGLNAELIKQKYFFDMGYAYYIIHRDPYLVVTSDLGMLVFTIN